MKVSITKEFTFDCAHMLSNHSGLCANLHGHTYKLQITVKLKDSQNHSCDLSSEGMVIDFKDLKTIVNELIINKFDHSFIYWEKGCEAEREIASIVKRYGLRIVDFNERPTAENLCKYFFQLLKDYFKLKDSTVDVVNVRLWETPTSFAEVNDDGISCC